MDLVSIVEALLFASQEPLSVGAMRVAVREAAKEKLEQAKEAGEDEDAQMKEWAEVDEVQIQGALDALIRHYSEDQRAFTVIERATGWRLCARAEYAEWCRALFPGRKPQRLSQPALETLAIIAYRQPITKAGIEAVRGVSVDAMVQQLLDRGMIRIEGRADLPGRPLLYGTTEAFLDLFGVRSLEELPNASELRRVKLPAEESPAEEQAEQGQQLELQTPVEAEQEAAQMANETEPDDDA